MFVCFKSGLPLAARPADLMAFSSRLDPDGMGIVMLDALEAAVLPLLGVWRNPRQRIVAVRKLCPEPSLCPVYPIPPVP